MNSKKLPKVPWLFVHIPRTAGSTIRRKLAGWDKISGIDTKAMGAAYPEIRGHLPVGEHLRQSRERVREDPNALPWDRIESFSFVRNPFDRATSIWGYVAKQMPWNIADVKAFQGWVKSGMPGRKNLLQYPATADGDPFDMPMCAPQVAWLREWERGTTWWTKGPIHVKHLLRYENINEEWDTFCRDVLLVEDPSVLDIYNASPNKIHDYRYYYNPETYDIVSVIYKNDLDTLGYSSVGDLHI